MSDQYKLYVPDVDMWTRFYKLQAAQGKLQSHYEIHSIITLLYSADTRFVFLACQAFVGRLFHKSVLQGEKKSEIIVMLLSQMRETHAKRVRVDSVYKPYAIIEHYPTALRILQVSTHWILKSKMSVLSFALCLFVVVWIQPDDTSAWSSRSVCGHRTYNPAFNLCCRGKVVSKSGLKPACCGYRSYDATFRSCCGGNVVSRSGLRPACCGRRSYDTTFRQCCRGKVVSKSGLTPSCCAKRSYDAAFRMCCGGNVVSKSGLRPACCGRISYDATFRKCCNGRIC
ncbi:uncharacterized protein LOC121381542 [Gigantopelta aegis]|uniref:uncharacterized protein LOC121381542 n=1 Tax=Gigantopelta aegis TaxID=1735272 RepID=UPI001B88DBB3|nr:uncharacterized protein LOC121381542 [Gigantopelta aegis]